MSLVALTHQLLLFFLLHKSHHFLALHLLDFLLMLLHATPIHDFLIEFGTVSLLLLLFPPPIVFQIANPRRTYGLLQFGQVQFFSFHPILLQSTTNNHSYFLPSVEPPLSHSGMVDQLALPMEQTLLEIPRVNFSCRYKFTPAVHFSAGPLAHILAGRVILGKEVILADVDIDLPVFHVEKADSLESISAEQSFVSNFLLFPDSPPLLAPVSIFSLILRGAAPSMIEVIAELSFEEGFAVIAVLHTESLSLAICYSSLEYFRPTSREDLNESSQQFRLFNLFLGADRKLKAIYLLADAEIMIVNLEDCTRFEEITKSSQNLRDIFDHQIFLFIDGTVMYLRLALSHFCGQSINKPSNVQTIHQSRPNLKLSVHTQLDVDQTCSLHIFVMNIDQLTRQQELMKEIEALSPMCFKCRLSEEKSRCEILVDSTRCKNDICIECYKKHRTQTCSSCAQSLEQHYKKGKTAVKSTLLEDASKLYNRELKIRAIEEFQQLESDLISLVAYFHIHPLGKKYQDPERDIRRILDNQKKEQRTIVTETAKSRQAQYLGKNFDTFQTGKDGCGCPTDYAKGLTLLRKSLLPLVPPPPSQHYIK